MGKGGKITYLKPSTTKIVVLAAVSSAITGLGFLLTAPVPLIPGAIHWRILAFLPCIFGILFGPVLGFLSGAIGNTLWAILGGYFNPATPVFDLTGVGLTGLIPGLFVKPHECETTTGSIKSALVSLVSGMIMVVIVAVGFDLVGAAPFIPATIFLILSDIPPIVIGTPIIVRALVPTMMRRGLLRERF